jgi:hypothetical protein
LVEAFREAALALHTRPDVAKLVAEMAVHEGADLSDNLFKVVEELRSRPYMVELESQLTQREFEDTPQARARARAELGI